jgi:hypothetical protein
MKESYREGMANHPGPEPPRAIVKPYLYYDPIDLALCKGTCERGFESVQLCLSTVGPLFLGASLEAIRELRPQRPDESSAFLNCV